MLVKMWKESANYWREKQDTTKHTILMFTRAKNTANPAMQSSDIFLAVCFTHWYKYLCKLNIVTLIDNKYNNYMTNTLRFVLITSTVRPLSSAPLLSAVFEVKMWYAQLI